MSTKVAEDKMSGTEHPYLVRAEKKVLDEKVLNLYNAMLNLRTKCTWQGMNQQEENKGWVDDFVTADAFVTKLYNEMLERGKERYIDYLSRPEYDAGMKALADGATRMKGANNRGEMVSYDWLLTLVKKCKAMQREYEEAWRAIRAWDAQNKGQARGVRFSGTYHAFSPKQEASMSLSVDSTSSQLEYMRDLLLL
jgi:hypothetical protein